jgi:23S rRNA pseudouridine2457 synthase
MKLLAFNKPYGVLCQFTDAVGRPTLAEHIRVPGVYAAGRLDLDSEGLLLLTDDGRLQAAIADPRAKHWKRYLVQVEGEPDSQALAQLCAGVRLDGQLTRPARARRVPAPDWLWPRHPPIRFRKAIPTAWIELEIHEGRNRQAYDGCRGPPDIAPDPGCHRSGRAGRIGPGTMAPARRRRAGGAVGRPNHAAAPYGKILR